ncbi:MAG: hypothetical protein ACTSXQ_04865 [Alphaproteobacteria bacterium]
MDDALDALQSKLAQMGINVNLAQKGINISEDNVTVLKNFFIGNAQIVQAITPMAPDIQKKVLLNLMSVQPQELQAILGAIQAKPESLMKLLTELANNPDILERFLTEAGA